jgi:hypothetical protein
MIEYVSMKIEKERNGQHDGTAPQGAAKAWL